MDRSRSYSRPSPSSTRRSPSPSTPRSTTTPRGRPVSSLSSSHHGSRSRSSSESSSRSPSRRSNQNHHEHHQDHQHHGLFKTSASLIAGIGLATVLAHKVWPKGVVHGDEDDWVSAPRAKHHHHHHHHHSSEHHHRRSVDAGRIVDHARSSHGRGDVLFVEEVGPFRRGDNNRRASLDPRAFERVEARPPRDERVRPAVLPYPETPYPGEKFYEPSRRRAPVPELIPVPR
ncbi:hypothetical protein AK830_g11551 [Neonectria ditissima]|uniref:Uncharacterized protein n=1 Tax=Neonectria ditissima TaxID=78410 RepID=A0A0P7B306_9HYPO|nr:hypothetical protein AK830_g11551 [Neonectria ditissima]